MSTPSALDPLGITLGLVAAVCQSVTYLLTRHYAEARAARGMKNAGLQLTVLGHFIMGVWALMAVPFLWPAHGINWAVIIWPLLGNLTGYTLGQIFQIRALRHAEASRVGPLMTTKLLFSGLLVLWFGQPVGGSSTHVTVLQWAGVIVCTVAGISINLTGGRMRSQAMWAIAGAAATFSTSDFCINLMIKALLQQPDFADRRFQASMVAGLLSYLSTGIMAVPLLTKYGSRRLGDWAEAVPFSMVWMSSMVGLYAAFARVGILLGTILQCTRGFITIIFAAALMRAGHHHIEPKTHHAVILRRLAAGILMFIGIVMYVVRDRATLDQLLHGPAAATTQK